MDSSDHKIPTPILLRHFHFPWLYLLQPRQYSPWFMINVPQCSYTYTLSQIDNWFHISFLSGILPLNCLTNERLSPSTFRTNSHTNYLPYAVACRAGQTSAYRLAPGFPYCVPHQIVNFFFQFHLPPSYLLVLQSIIHDTMNYKIFLAYWINQNLSLSTICLMWSPWTYSVTIKHV